jgi:hypothetical protein
MAATSRPIAIAIRIPLVFQDIWRSSLMPSFNWRERSDELNRVGQQGNGDHDAGKEGRIYTKTANAPPDCPCDCDNDSHDHGREKKLHAVILAADSALGRMRPIFHKWIGLLK